MVGEFIIKDKKLECHHCNNSIFFKKKAQLNTAVMTFFDLDFMNPSAEVFVCSNCKYLFWFLEPEMKEISSTT